MQENTQKKDGIKLREYQESCVQAVFDYYENNSGCPLIVGPTGMGKSLIQAELCRRIITTYPDQRLLCLTHVKELVEQNHQKLLQYWPLAPVGVYCASLNERRAHDPITIASIQSIYKKAHQIGWRSLIFIDECFTAETIICTNAGDKTIDKVRCGDIVYTADGMAEVVAKSVKNAYIIYKVRLSNGREFRCTGNHPILSDTGWVKAQDLERGSQVFCVQDMPKLWQSLPPMAGKRRCAATNIIRAQSLLLNILFKEARKLHVDSGHSGKDERISKENWAQATCAWWKRQRADKNANNDGRNAWLRMGYGASYSDKDSTQAETVSDMLQSGLGASNKEDGNRVRWGEPQRKEALVGREEGQLFSDIRVESVEIEKPRGGELVYNIQTNGHPSYFANGILAHNCHLLGRNESGMYRQLIKDMAAINPKIKVIGLTATPYRTSSGLLHVGDDAIFTDVAIDIPVKRLIDEGYLSTLITKSSLTQADLSQVKTVAGEFNIKQAEAAMDVDAITSAALDEILSVAGNRKSWLFFCTGIKHAEHVRDAIRLRGISCETVHSKISQDSRADILERFKNGEIQALTNANVLTTGFDAPNIDLLVLLRPTKSPGLYVQMIGRGTRLHPGKENCLILDFAGNVERFGPITHVRPPSYKKEYKAEKKDFWICGICRMANPQEETVCQECGTAKPYVEREMVTHEATASSEAILSDAPNSPFETIEVRDITYDKHYKANSPVSMVVTYNGKYKEWICLEHEGFARAKAEGWWKRRAGTDAPDVQGALDHIRTVGIAEPTQITIKHEDKYKRVVNYEFETGRQTTTAIFA